MINKVTHFENNPDTCFITFKIIQKYKEKKKVFKKKKNSLFKKEYGIGNDNIERRI